MSGNNINMNNILLDTDAYKVSMWQQYPPNTEYVSSYVEARKSALGRVTFYGLQGILKELTTPITAEEVEFANDYWMFQGLPFNRDGWMYIVEEHGGKLPLKIQAVSEGTRMEAGNVLVQVINTDPKVPWLTTWVETKLMRVWYPTTVATLSARIREKIKAALELTADDAMAELPFKLHDFGSRGVSSNESAGIGGSAHLLNFNGTDTGAALIYAMQNYNASVLSSAGSIPAAEHSTITSWGRENEANAYRNMLDQFGSGLVAVVSDSYDLMNAIDNIWGDELKDKVEAMEGMLIVRPDSGDPNTIPLEVIKRLDAKFGSTLNTKGYKVLNNVRAIQGDGINEVSIDTIISSLINAGYSISNIAFGMGGALLQEPTRDTLSFAMKASAAKINNEWDDVYKDPITDPGKTSKKGRLALVLNSEDELVTIREDELVDVNRNMLFTVFENGEMPQPLQQWDSIVARARLD